MSKKGGAKTATTETRKIDPTAMNLALGNYAKADDIATNGFKGYTGERVADFTTTQLDAQNAYRGIGTGSSAGLGQARDVAQGLTTFTPNQVTGLGYQAERANASQINRGAVRDVQAGLLKDADLSGYLNPHTQNVVDLTLADLRRQREIELIDNRNRAQASNAFGGDRHAVLESLTNDNYLRNSALTSAQLRQAGYDRAVDGAVGDLNRRFTADQGNQGHDFNVANANAGYATQAELANAGAVNQARQFGAGQDFAAQSANQAAGLQAAGVRANAAGLLSSLSDQELQQSLTRAGALQGVGDAQQQLEQARLQAAYEEYLRGQQWLAAGQGLRNDALAAVPVGYTQTGTTTQKQGTGVGDVIGPILSLASMLPVTSDERLKTEVTTAGYDGKGRRWVDFRYLWDEPGTLRRGVIAQEVAKSDPEAVAEHPAGFLTVDYSKLGA